MCDPVTAALVAAGASAGGTVLSMTASQRQAKEKQDALNQGQEAQSAIQRKANARTDQFVTDTYTPENRLANYETQATQGEKTLGDLLSNQSAAGQGDVTGATTGAVSDAYTRAKAKTTADTTQNSRKLAYLMARSGAGANLARNEATAGSDYSSDMLGYGVDSKMTQNRMNVGLSNASNSDNGLALLGGLLSGSAGAIGGLGGAAKAPLPLQVGM